MSRRSSMPSTLLGHKRAIILSEYPDHHVCPCCRFQVFLSEALTPAAEWGLAGHVLCVRQRSAREVGVHRCAACAVDVRTAGARGLSGRALHAGSLQGFQGELPRVLCGRARWRCGRGLSSPGDGGGGQIHTYSGAVSFASQMTSPERLFFCMQSRFSRAP